MTHLTPAALEWLSTHHGIISTERLRASGVSSRTWKRLVSVGVLLPLAKGVYRIASTPDSVDATCASLCAAHPTGFVTGPTGAMMRSLRRQPRNSVIHFSVPHGHELRLMDGIRLRQSRKVVPALDIEVRSDGIKVATPARLAFDLAADLQDVGHQSIVEQILHDRLCGVGALVAIGKRLATPQRPGSARFMRTLESRLPGGPLESHPEVEVAMALRARGVPIQAQATWLTLPGGRRIRLDLSVPEVRWGVEVDVHHSHFLLEGNTADRDRDRKCHLIGWQVERATKLDLLDLDKIIDELVELYHVRRAEFEQTAA